jgi:glycogen operon protein
VLRRRRWFQGLPLHGEGVQDIAWFAPDGKEMTESDWQVSFARTLGMFLNGDQLPATTSHANSLRDASLFVVFNAFWEQMDFVLPRERFGSSWSYVLDTAAEPSFVAPGGDDLLAGTPMPVAGRSVVMLVRAAR